MVRSLSIRGRLALHALLTGIVMLALALLFFWSQKETDRALERVFAHEIVPATRLRMVSSTVNAIHARMQSVRLAQSSALGALYLLERQREIVRENWEAFRGQHLNWSGDPREDVLIAAIEAELPALWQFLDRAEAAYRIHDPVELATLAESGWYQLQDSLLHGLRELAEIQSLHIAGAQRELDHFIHRSRIAMGALLLGGLLLLGAFAVGLSRHIMRRIAGVERALDAVAAGATTVSIPYRPGETEMARFASAINRTVAQLASSHLAISALMHRQQTILESAGEGVYGVDNEGRIMFVNPAALAMLGYQEHELIGQASHETLHHHYPDGRPYPNEDCPIAGSRRTAHVHHRDDEVFFRKNGEPFPVEYTSAPLLDLDDSIGGVVVFHDITERRRQEQLLRRTVEQLRDTNARLAETQSQLIQAEKLAGLGQLAAGVAHEINNPIGFISSNFANLEAYVDDLLELIEGYESLMNDALAPGARTDAGRLRELADLDFVREDIRALVAESREGLRRVTDIVANLRDFSRLDSGVDWTEADLQRGLESAIKVVGASLGDDIEIVRDYAVVPAVRCNAGQLNQVFLNLLLNAAHAVGSTGTITLRTWQRASEVCIEFRDSGHGMEPTVRERMFDPFFTTKPVGKGTGLGLSVSYSIIQRHGGRFEVDSAVEQGTAVRVWLPVAGPPAGEESVQPHSQSPTGTIRTS